MTFLRSQDLYPAEPARGWIPWGALAPFLVLVFIIATALPGDMLISKFVNISPEGNPLDPAALVAFTLVPFGFLLLLLLAWVRFVERRSLASIGIRGEHKLREFLRGHAFGLAGLFAVVMIIWMAGGLELTAVAPAFSQPASLRAYRAPAVHVRVAVERRRNGVPRLAAVGAREEIQRAHCGRRELGAVLAAALQSARSLAGVRRHVPVRVVCLRLGAADAQCARHHGLACRLELVAGVGFGLPVTGLDVGIPALLFDLQPVGADWLTGGPQGPEASVVCFGYFVLGIVLLRFQPGKASIAS